MKKLFAVAGVVALAIPVLAQASSPYASSFKDGKYEGTITSVVPDINGKKATMEVKHEGDNVIATVSYEGGKEVWTFNDKTLTQKEIDTKTNAISLTYGATARKPATPNEQTFNINCKDQVKNDCDANIDHRNTWTVQATPEGMKYVVYGVSKDKKNDTAATAEKRHEFVFRAAAK